MKRLSALAAVVALMTWPAAFGQDPSVRQLSAGLVAKIVTASRSCNGESMTIGIDISNQGQSPVDIIFAEKFSAIDNAGTAYRYRSYDGTARCNHGYVEDCLGLSGRGAVVALGQYSRLDPGASALATFDLWHSTPTQGTLVTFSSVYGYRPIDVNTESRSTDAEKRRAVRTINIGFPPFPLTAIGCR